MPRKKKTETPVEVTTEEVKVEETPVEVTEEVKEETEEVKEETPVEVTEEVKEETPVEVTSNVGVVTCNKLFVRNRPTKFGSTIISIISKGTEVTVDHDNSTKEFYKVTVNKINGYCMKEFIKIV